MGAAQSVIEGDPRVSMTITKPSTPSVKQNPIDMDLTQLPKLEALKNAVEIMTHTIPSSNSSNQRLLTRVKELIVELAADAERNSKPVSRRMSTRDEKEARASRVTELKMHTKNDTEMHDYITRNFDDIKEAEENGSSFGSRKLKKLIDDDVSCPAELLKRASEVIAVDFIPSGLSEANLTKALEIAMAIDQSDWSADLTTLCGILATPMTFVVELVLKKYHAAEELKLEPAVLRSMLLALEDGYLPNPYHNRNHAADVAYTFHVMLANGAAKKMELSNLQQIAGIIASAAHDFRHNGLTNQFLVATRHPLALTYNDRAVLENMHTSQFLLMLHKKPEFNILKNLDAPQITDVRKCMITTILATDMMVHFEYLARFQAKFIDDDEPPKNDEEKNFLMSMLCHAADISNPAKPRRLYLEWTDRVLAEFYHVGDLEREQGFQKLSMFCDRKDPKVQKCQSGFISFIVKPMFVAWENYVKELAGMCVTHCDANLAIWANDVCKVPESQLFADVAKLDWDHSANTWKLGDGLEEYAYTDGLLSDAP